MAFEPDSFLQAARTMSNVASTEADFRTVAGRCYYAVYGYLRERLCAAKGTTPEILFGGSGLHGRLAKRVSLVSPFTEVGFLYNGLLTRRTNSDYKYRFTVSRDDAGSALKDAEWVLRKLRDIGDEKFETFPLEPPTRA